MEKLTVPYNFIPRDYQLELYQELDSTDKKRALLRWHRRAGKDKCCWCYMLKEAVKTPGNYFYIFPTKTMARQALWENIDKDGFKLLNHLPKPLINRLSNQEMSVELKAGPELKQVSTIRVIGYDKDPDSARGIACKGAVLSEFAFSDPECYRILIPSLRESQGWLLINSTPNGRNHYYDLYEKVKDSKNWFVSSLQTLWPDQNNYSGLITPEEMPVIQAEEGLSEEDVEREYGVSFLTGLKGAIYHDQIATAWETKRVGDFLWDDTIPVNTYWDIGKDDDTVIWFAQKVGNSIVFIDYWEGNNQGTNDFARMLSRKPYEYDKHYLPHDAAHGKIAQEVVTTQTELEESLDNYGVTGLTEVVPKTSSVQSSILAVRRRFSRYKFDLNNCQKGLDHLELYSRKLDKRKRTYLPEPLHDIHSHAADAFRMEAESQVLLAPQQKQRVVVNFDFDPFA